MEQSINNSYPIKVWIYTLLLAPLIFAVVLWVYSGSDPNDFFAAWPLAFLMIGVSSLLSLPALWLYWLLFKELRNSNKPVWIKKILLSIAGISLIWTTLYLLFLDSFSDGDADLYVIAGIYSFILLTASFLVKMMNNNYPGATHQPIN
jgi:hypothetical protein